MSSIFKIKSAVFKSFLMISLFSLEKAAASSNASNSQNIIFDWRNLCQLNELLLQTEGDSTQDLTNINPSEQIYADNPDWEQINKRLALIPDTMSDDYVHTKDIVDYSLYESRKLTINTQWIEDQWFRKISWDLRGKVELMSPKMYEIYEKRFQKCVNSNDLKKSFSIVFHMINQHINLFEKRYDKLLEETQGILKGEKDLFGSDLIKKNDKDQRRYFSNSLLIWFEGEKKDSQEILEELQGRTGYVSFCRLFGGLACRGLIYNAYMKGLIRNKMNKEEQLLPQEQSVTFQQYDCMDVTDKVCFSQLLANAELMKDTLEVLLPILEKTKAMTGELSFYNDLSTLHKGFVDELAFFELGRQNNLPEEVFENINVSEEIKAIEEKKSKSKKKREAKKRKKMAEEILEKKQDELKKTIITPSRSVVVKKEESKKEVVEESYSAWYERTIEKIQPSVTVDARENAKHAIARQQRKADAKASRKGQIVYQQNNNNNNNHHDHEEIIDAKNIQNTTLNAKLYSVFQEIMNETYVGELEPILNLIQNGFDGFARNGNGSRVRISLRNKDNNSLIANDLIVPFDDFIDGRQEDLNTNKANSEERTGGSKLVLHRPHKRGSKCLRPEHVKELKNCFERAGYTLETVHLRAAAA